MKRTTLSSLLASSLLGLALSQSAMAAEPKIARIIVVQTTDAKAYVREVASLQGMFKKAGQQVTIRVFRAVYAGPEAGTIVVAVEVPNWAALGAINALQSSNAEISAEMQKIGGLRKIVSDSVYEELTQ